MLQRETSSCSGRLRRGLSSGCRALGMRKRDSRRLSSCSRTRLSRKPRRSRIRICSALAPGMVVDANDLAVRHTCLEISRDSGDDTPETLHLRLVGRMRHGRMETRWQPHSGGRRTFCSSPAPRRWPTCARTRPARASRYPTMTSPNSTRSAAKYYAPLSPRCPAQKGRPAGLGDRGLDQVGDLPLYLGGPVGDGV